jgi:hypothetical protein
VFLGHFGVFLARFWHRKGLFLAFLLHRTIVVTDNLANSAGYGSLGGGANWGGDAGPIGLFGATVAAISQAFHDLS